MRGPRHVAAGCKLRPNEVRPVAKRLAGRDDRAQVVGPRSAATGAELASHGWTSRMVTATSSIPPTAGASTQRPGAGVRGRSGAVAPGRHVCSDAVRAVANVGDRRRLRRRRWGRGRGRRRGDRLRHGIRGSHGRPLSAGEAEEANVRRRNLHDRRCRCGACRIRPNSIRSWSLPPNPPAASRHIRRSRRPGSGRAGPRSRRSACRR